LNEKCYLQTSPPSLRGILKKTDLYRCTVPLDIIALRLPTDALIC